MDRKQKLLAHVRRTGPGVEIGPSHNPTAPKREGFQVHIIDCLDREGLRKKYRNEPGALENIEEVDFLWSGESYAELTGHRQHYDWVIASHVVEHTPDLIGFLRGCEALLKPDGVLSLAIPDKRYCFDYFRPISGLGKVLDAHAGRLTRHTAGTAAEFELNASKRDGVIAWSADHPGRNILLNPLSKAHAAMERAEQVPAYQDFHAWCFTPHSFRLMMEDLFALEKISLREVAFFDTAGCEFFVTLGRQGTGTGLDRTELLEQIGRELSEEHVGAEIRRGEEILATERAAREAACAEHEQERTRHEAEAAALRAEIHTLRSSLSWKCTKPLRWLERVLRSPLRRRD